MTRILLIAAIFVGCYIGNVSAQPDDDEMLVFTAEQVWSGEATEILAKQKPKTKNEFIKIVIKECKGDVECKIPYETAQFYNLNYKLKEDEELLVTDVSGGQITYKVVKVAEAVVNIQDLPPAERIANALEKMAK